MNCSAFRREIEEAEAGQRLSDETRCHLAECISCRTFRDERHALSRLMGTLEMISAPPDFEFRLRSRLAPTPQNPSLRLRRIRRSLLAPGFVSIALAASFALIVASVALFNQNKIVRTGNTRSPEIAGLNSATDLQSQSLRSAASESFRSSQKLKMLGQSNTSALGHRTGNISRNVTGRISPAGKSSDQTASLNAAKTHIKSAVFSGGSATVVLPTRTVTSDATLDPLMTAPLDAAVRPSKVWIDGLHNPARSSTTPPIIFGSQRFIEHGDARRAFTLSLRGMW